MYRLVTKSDSYSEAPGEHEQECADVYALRAAFDHCFAMAVQHAKYERIEAFVGDKRIAAYDRNGV